MAVAVKICGLKTEAALAAAVQGGASFVGFVFFPASPRALTPCEAARLVVKVPPGIRRVAVVVDADDLTLETILTAAPFDFVQCHGRETVARARAIRERFRIGVIKAVPVAEAADLDAAAPYEDAVDWLLFDSRAPNQARHPGGNALAFDWSLLRGRAWRRPWLLAGGLHAGNLAEALRLSGAAAVDVSSGIEDVPGEKSLAKIGQFLAVAKDL